MLRITVCGCKIVAEEVMVEESFASVMIAATTRKHWSQEQICMGFESRAV